MSRFTLYGCYQYDPTLFDQILVPQGCDKQALINEIMAYCGQLYPYHQVPAQLKLNINFWFKRMFYNFSRMFQAINSDFSPVENYDRYEDRSTSESSAFSESTSSYMSDSSSHSESQLNDISAFNSSEYAPSDRNQIAGTNKSSNAQNGLSRNAGNRDYHESVHIHGNIGVMEASTMIQHTIDLYQKNDVYKKIAEMFEKEFILQIY